MSEMIGPYELNSIVTGGARELAEVIPDNSIDLIFTDPVYDRIEDYEWLAKTAARVLKDDSACLAFVDSRHDAAAQIAMEKWLNYQWKLYYTIPGKPGALHLYGLYPCTTVCLLFAKGHRKASPYLPDTLVSMSPPDNGFKWQKNEAVVSRWLQAFSQGGLVVDFFCGSGTIPSVCKKLRLDFWACEIDPATAEAARQRVLLTQPPLIVPQPTQLYLMSEG